ncbi:roadblock/LC7 domain-containing protein [Streptomyces sp. V3I7]|uniref:roadblock/LC7 domain-containing protein n=1 Tax=Streptomyces sp. V3I7 TaxID=3042278 RepID=UPI00277E4CF4|nr:roadblock/LC7 domain-containing protein [Streptomyces sp. V3I7]MDQ0990732.1 putative regulator of Ras-like GTPase activity (Roadblock/LC7/MglB family) [Streptomyces sp. V3I7]
MAYDATGSSTVLTPQAVQGQMTRLLDEFVADTAGVTHVLLVSTDGMKQAICSHMDPDWADGLAAAFSGIAGLAKGITGRTDEMMPARQVLIERDDTLFLVTHAGAGSTFSSSGDVVATVLVVLTVPDANIGSVAYSAGRLVQRFAPFMTTPVRTRTGQDSGVE